MEAAFYKGLYRASRASTVLWASEFFLAKGFLVTKAGDLRFWASGLAISSGPVGAFDSLAAIGALY